MGANVFLNAATAKCTLHVKPTSLSTYQTTEQWKDFFNKVGDLEDEDYNPLDVNGDGKVNAADANVIIAEILAHPDGDGNKKYDVNNDDKVNAADANVIIAYILAHPDE